MDRGRPAPVTIRSSHEVSPAPCERPPLAGSTGRCVRRACRRCARRERARTSPPPGTSRCRRCASARPRGSSTSGSGSRTIVYTVCRQSLRHGTRARSGSCVGGSCHRSPARSQPPTASRPRKRQPSRTSRGARRAPPYSRGGQSASRALSALRWRRPPLECVTSRSWLRCHVLASSLALRRSASSRERA